MAPRCMHSAALVASFTAVSIRMATLGSSSSSCGTRSMPLTPGIRTSSSMHRDLLPLQDRRAPPRRSAAVDTS